MHRTWGGIVAGALFVLPSLFILIALSWVYVAFGEVRWVAGLFYGIKPAVAAIVLHAVWRIGSRTLKHPRKVPLLWAIARGELRRHRRAATCPFPGSCWRAALVGVAGRHVLRRRSSPRAAATARRSAGRAAAGC